MLAHRRRIDDRRDGKRLCGGAEASRGEAGNRADAGSGRPKEEFDEGLAGSLVMACGWPS